MPAAICGSRARRSRSTSRRRSRARRLRDLAPRERRAARRRRRARGSRSRSGRHRGRRRALRQRPRRPRASASTPRVSYQGVHQPGVPLPEARGVDPHREDAGHARPRRALAQALAPRGGRATSRGRPRDAHRAGGVVRARRGARRRVPRAPRARQEGPLPLRGQRAEGALRLRERRPHRREPRGRHPLLGPQDAVLLPRAACSTKLGIKAEFVRIGAHKSAPEQFTNEHASDVARADHEDFLRQVEAVFVQNLAHRPPHARGAHARGDRARVRSSRARRSEAGFVDGFAFDDEIERVDAASWSGTHVSATRSSRTRPEGPDDVRLARTRSRSSTSTATWSTAARSTIPLLDMRARRLVHDRRDGRRSCATTRASRRSSCASRAPAARRWRRT